MPKAYSPEKPTPIVFDLHGYGSPADLQARVTGYESLADREGFAVVSPQGGDDGTGRWDVRLSEGPRNTDVVYLLALLDKLESELCVDVARVYATGISNGAMMASALSCLASDRFAAIASVAGELYPSDSSQCPASRPVPYMAIHGTADRFVPYGGGRATGLRPPDASTTSEPVSATSPPPALVDEFRPVEDIMADRARANGCGAQAQTEQVSAAVQRRVWSGCDRGADVELWVIDGGGHTWPGSAFSAAQSANPVMAEYVGTTNMDIDATEEGWRFLQRHPLE